MKEILNCASQCPITAFTDDKNLIKINKDDNSFINFRVDEKTKQVLLDINNYDIDFNVYATDFIIAKNNYIVIVRNSISNNGYIKVADYYNLTNNVRRTYRINNEDIINTHNADDLDIFVKRNTLQFKNNN